MLFVFAGEYHIEYGYPDDVQTVTVRPGDIFLSRAGTPYTMTAGPVAGAGHAVGDRVARLRLGAPVEQSLAVDLQPRPTQHSPLENPSAPS
jgi:hypothetical protein